ncbi:MAG: hypothetical protein KGI75_10975 [Rhizobiaceae bacterium]|nr:hypothetical protein [Rhizobiaceae bacterium]
MGLFDWLGGRKSPAKGMQRHPVVMLRQALLAINRDTAPFIIRDGSPEGVDLVGEWKIVDARWYEIFAEAGIEKAFKVLMKFDDANGEVRALDQEWSVEWRAGVPRLSLNAEVFRGRKWEVSFESVTAFREDLSFGKVYEYYFKSSEIKKPLQAAVLNAGWAWKSVALGKL